MTTDGLEGVRALILVSRSDWVPDSTPRGVAVQSATDAVSQVRAAALSGVDSVVLFQTGETASGACVIVSDHINLTGANPLVGPNVEAWGVRFPDMTDPYPLRHQLARLEVADSTGDEHGAPANAAPGEDARYAPGTDAAGVSAEGVTADIPAEPRQADLAAVRALGAASVTSGLAGPVIAANHCGLRVGAVVVPPGVDGKPLVERALSLFAG